MRAIKETLSFAGFVLAFLTAAPIAVLTVIIGTICCEKWLDEPFRFCPWVRI